MFTRPSVGELATVTFSLNVEMMVMHRPRKGASQLIFIGHQFMNVNIDGPHFPRHFLINPIVLAKIAGLAMR